MRKEKIVYIIGAGASKGDGIPLLDDIKDALKKLIDVCRDSEIVGIDRHKYSLIERKRLESAYKYWEINFPDKNIEEVMTYLSKGDENNHLNDFKYSYVAVIMYYAYYYDYYQNSKKEPKHSVTYVKFINKVLSENADIISLNVDNQICDCIYGDEELNNIILTKFSQERKNYIEESARGDEKQKYQYKREVAASLTEEWKPFFRFIRLHGSISFPNNDDSKHSITVSLLSHTQDLIDGKFRVLYPTFTKRYFTGKKSENFYGELEDALALIKEAKKIIVIGYSFPISDTYWISEFYEAIFQNRNNPEIEVVNPAFKKHGCIANNYLQAILSKYMKNVKFFPYKFEEFLRLS